MNDDDSIDEEPDEDKDSDSLLSVRSAPRFCGEFDMDELPDNDRRISPPAPTHRAHTTKQQHNTVSMLCTAQRAPAPSLKSLCSDGGSDGPKTRLLRGEPSLTVVGGTQQSRLWRRDETR